MQAMMSRRSCKIIAIVLFSLSIGAVLACHIHTTPLGHQHDIPGQHQSDASAFSFPSMSCVAAILPVMLVFLVVLFQLPYDISLMLNHTTPTSLFFVPPRHLAA